jgi:glycosyltransferase involved in cell wall biosynthesis
VIVDDGSTDISSVNRLVEISSGDSRIKVIHQDNAGPGAARNVGFRHSTGQYICILDSDDMLEPTYLEKCVWFLVSNPDFAFCNAFSVFFGDKKCLSKTGFERGKLHLLANSGPPISVIRRIAFSDCGGFDESIKFGHEDWDFWLAMARSGHWGYTIPEYLQWYRKRGNGRFEQIMKTDGINVQFEAMIKQKYMGLEKLFPAPIRHYPQPYESIETELPFSNSLEFRASGHRFLFLLPWMVTGGADRVNLDLVEGLVEQDHSVTVCATLMADHCWQHQFSRFTSDIFVLPIFLQPCDYPRFLVYLIQSRHIDSVVVTGSTLGYQLLPYIKAMCPGVALVDLCHVEEPHWQNGGHPRFGVGYQDVLDLNLVTTRHLANWMQGRGADPKRIKVMYSGVRPVEMQLTPELRIQAKLALGMSPDLPVIVFAGRFCEQKRPMFLAAILNELKVRGAVFQAVIIGDGELKKSFDEAINGSQLVSQVYMIGSVSHEHWLKTLLISDIFLMPSAYEGISIALLEAISAGVVPVVARVGGQDEIVSSNVGFLIGHGTNELEEYVIALMTLLTNTAQLQIMSTQASVLAASRLSWQQMILRFLTLIDEAHQLNQKFARHTIDPGLGRELATLALENKRLGDAVDWLWHSKDSPSTPAGSAVGIPIDGIFRLLHALGTTRLGAAVLRSRKLRAFGKWLFAKLESSRPA